MKCTLPALMVALIIVLVGCPAHTGWMPQTSATFFNDATASAPSQCRDASQRSITEALTELGLTKSHSERFTPDASGDEGIREVYKDSESYVYAMWAHEELQVLANRRESATSTEEKRRERAAQLAKVMERHRAAVDECMADPASSGAQEVVGITGAGG